MDNKELEKALTDPNKVPYEELDTLLEAQFNAIQSMRALQNTKTETKNTSSKKRRALKHFNKLI